MANKIVEALTDRQKEVLLRTARGQNAREIASAMGISENAVWELSSRVKDKLGANTLAHAVHLAASWRIIPPADIG